MICSIKTQKSLLLVPKDNFPEFNELIKEQRKQADEKDMPCIETKIIRILFKRLILSHVF